MIFVTHGASRPGVHTLWRRFPAARINASIFVRSPDQEEPTMPIGSKANSRSQINRCLLAIGFTSLLSPFAMSSPVDEPLPPGSASTKAAVVSPNDNRPEISLLSTLDDSEMLSVGDLLRNPQESESARTTVASTTQLLQQRFDNGKVKVERFVSEDAEGNLVNHGPYKEYDSSGALIRSGSYAFGNLDGLWSQTVANEKVQSLSAKLDPAFKPPFKSEANFVDGQLHGDWTIVDSKGNPVFLWQFDLGTRDNVSTWFDSRHATILEMMYTGGVPNGVSSQLVPGQREPKKVVFDHGRVVETKTNWYEKGKKRSEEMYLSPAAKRLVSHDWWTSTVVSKTLPDIRIRRN